MPEIDYKINPNDQTIINSSVNSLRNRMNSGELTQEELRNLGRLLNVTKENFAQYKAQTWFKKAWYLISGKKGHMTDVAVNNLGKIHIGVLKVMSEFLQDSSLVKDDVLILFESLKQVNTKILEAKWLLIKFNEKYSSQFRELRKEIKATKRSLNATQVILGITLILGAGFVFIPSLALTYSYVGAISWGLSGFLLISLAASNVRQKKLKPIPISDMRIAKLDKHEKSIKELYNAPRKLDRC